MASLLCSSTNKEWIEASPGCSVALMSPATNSMGPIGSMRLACLLEGKVGPRVCVLRNPLDIVLRPSALLSSDPYMLLPSVKAVTMLNCSLCPLSVHIASDLVNGMQLT